MCVMLRQVLNMEKWWETLSIRGKHGKHGKYGKLVRNSVQRASAIRKKTSLSFGFYSQNFMGPDALDLIEFQGPRGIACLGLRTAQDD